MKKAIAGMVESAKADATEDIKPRDEFEVAVINALGEISWDEAISAILKHRTELVSGSRT